MTASRSVVASGPVGAVIERFINVVPRIMLACIMSV